MDHLTIPLFNPMRASWSPLVVALLSISQVELATLFEVARWAGSSFNEQPRRFRHRELSS